MAMVEEIMLMMIEVERTASGVIGQIFLRS